MIVTNRGTGCGGRGCADNERRFSADVRSRVVLTPRRWCQVCEKERSRRWPTSPEHRGEHGVAVKTIAWGMPGDSGVTCMLVCAFYYILHARPRGASVARHSLRPQFGEGGRFRQTSGRMRRRDRESMSQRHCEPTGRANARPMTGSAKQSIGAANAVSEEWIASSQGLLAMTLRRNDVET